MNILIVTQNFYPESFKSNDVAFDLVKKGHQVTVLTGIPNYPQGKYFEGYGLCKKRSEIVKGVKIIRSILVPRGKGNTIGLLLNYFSWFFFASFKILTFKDAFDVILVHQTSPVLQGIPAFILKKRKKIPVYFWVLDLWPESLTSAGGVKNKYVLSFFSKIVTYMYKHADKILISSNGFRQSILEKGDFQNKIIYFPNWAEDVFKKEVQFNIPKLPDGFKVMFAGNIGEAQDLEHILKAVLKLKSISGIKFIFLGDGRKKEWVKEFVDKNNLQGSVFLMGRFPLQAMPAFFHEADVMLLSLKSELIFNLTVPARLQAYMSSSKPVIGMIDGEGAQLIKKAKCGYAVKASDSDALAEKIKYMYALRKDELIELGKNGKDYFEMYFSKEKCLNHLVDILSESL
jgi:putative glycosyltransferase